MERVWFESPDCKEDVLWAGILGSIARGYAGDASDMDFLTVLSRLTSMKFQIGIVKLITTSVEFSFRPYNLLVGEMFRSRAYGEVRLGMGESRPYRGSTRKLHCVQESFVYLGPPLRCTRGLDIRSICLCTC
jgi:hypothetical protein